MLSNTLFLITPLILNFFDIFLNSRNVNHHRAGHITEPATFFYTKKSTFLALPSQALLDRIL